MTLPTLIFGFIISTLLGALFHLLRGGGIGKLVLYLVLGWLGFWAGHLVAVWVGLDIGSFGSLRLGPALLVALIFLLVGHWLSLAAPERPPNRRRY